MKYILSFALLVIISLNVSAQQTSQKDFEVGDQVVLEESSNQQYQFVKFPKKNFIMKRGGVANIKGLYHTKLTIVKITESGEWVHLSKADGSKFFNRYSTIKAHLPKAVEAGELRMLNP
ncbi:MAG: hypothetical protein KJO49_00075 [Bacteroidia bacterium]|nr:hypothetical protein [Bacteroidia bacterium]MBT8267602.1 hypothetical protein [Bacteroidia bacterium]NNF81894.1 hypothetical protein [Flavobacteriaceae bacterium]NNK70464.1 hypothetical protein [Flavobacteriaceae bacterium]NNL79749.1 hypothetical protein [Flavobacteriaceae bacterium]